MSKTPTKAKASARKRDRDFLGTPVPSSMFRAVERAVQSLDSDKSKFIRAAVREKLEGMGIAV